MARDRDWILPIGAFLALQYAVLSYVSWLTRFTDFPPVISYSITAMVLASAGAIAIFLFRLWSMWREGETSPLYRILRGDWLAALTYFLGFELVALHICAMTWAKEMIPVITTYWADPYIASAEHGVLGFDTWRAFPSFLVRPLDDLYPAWAIVKFLALFMVLFSPASAFKTRAMLSYLLAVAVLGTVGQYILPSVGPVLYDQFHGGHRFAGLTERLAQQAPMAHAASSYLWDAFGRHHIVFGGGISAMPSMHVTTTTWAALVIAAKFPRLKFFAFGFWFIILCGSVALGWHYLSDGIIGTTGALLFWHLMRSSASDPSRASGAVWQRAPRPHQFAE